VALEDYRRDAWDCVRCSHCKYIHPYRVRSHRFSRICPSSIYYTFDGYSAQGRLDIARGLIDKELGEGNLDELSQVIYTCTLCGSCDVMCKYYNDIDTLLVLEELRVQCVEGGYLPSRLKEVIASIQEKGNPLFQPRDKREEWAKGLDLKDVAESREKILYYPGCNYSYDHTLQKIPRLTARILAQAGIDFGILGNRELCCGTLALQAGDRASFAGVAQTNVKLLNRLGIKKLITSCPICYSTFKVDYSRYGLDTKCEVLHSTEVLAQLLEEGSLRLKKKVPLAVTYHDPCHLGRLGEPYHAWTGKRVKYGRYVPPSKELRQGTYGIYQAPRTMLRAIKGLKLVEMERSHEYSFCCGAGGGVREAYPEFSSATAFERIEEGVSTGAEALVTSCPWCESNFKRALQQGGQKIKLYSVLDLVSTAL
jgi:Fe-S oxidoreductase